MVLEACIELENQQHLEALFCVDCLKDALRLPWQARGVQQRPRGKGIQFTSESLTGVLHCEGVTISMDGRGRAYDNIFVKRLWRSVKYEAIYLNGSSTMGELRLGLTKYFDFYNSERPHRALENRKRPTKTR